MRGIIIFTAVLLAFIGSLVAVFATAYERDEQLRGYVDATQNPDLPYRVPRLGVNAELTQYPPDILKTQLDRMGDAHITWVRQIFPWDAIEPEPDQYVWDKWDTIVNSVNQYPDLRLIAVLVNSPTWARKSDNPTAPPDDPVTFAAFAHTFAARYGQSIDYYQVWDEPNLIAAWGGQEPRPVEYLALLQAAYHSVHSADSSATVIAGGLAPTLETGPKNISDILYLHDLYALGAKDFMDAVAAKPHGFNTPPTDRSVAENTLNFSRMVALREEMVRQDDGKKALWAVSWGWNSLPENWSGAPSIWGSVTADEQVRYTLAALDRVEREMPWLAGMTLQHWQPAVPSDDPLWGFALIDHQNTPKPLWTALAQRPSPTTAQNGLFHPKTPSAHYSGVWTFGTLGADIGWLETTDSQLELDFIGQAVALLLRRDNYIAYLYPTVDNQPANGLPRDSAGNAYINLQSANLEPNLSLVSVARDLVNGQHTLRVIANRGQDRWALAGYAVSSGDLAAPYNRQITIAWFTTLVTAFSALIGGWRLNWGALSNPIKMVWQRLTDTGQIAISVITSFALMIGMLLTWNDSLPHIFRRDAVQLGAAVLTAGIVYLNPGFILTILAALILFAMIYHRIDLGLILAIFFAPFFLFPVELYRFAFPMVEIISILTTAAWMLRLLASWGRNRQSNVSQFPSIPFKERLRQLTSLDYAILAWLVLGIISLVWTPRRPPALTELRTMMLEPALFYLILRTTPPDRKTFIRLVDALLIAGLVVAMIGLFNYVRGEAVITAEQGARRLASVYGSPNNVALFLGRCLPFTLAYGLIPTHRWRRYLAIVTLIIMGLALFLTQSVGALFLGIPAAVIVVLFLALGRKAWLILLILAVLSLAGLGIAARSERFRRVLDFSSGTNFFRLRVWESSLNLIHDYPITGIGLDQFLYIFRERYRLPDAEAEPNLSHPHNFVLDFWVRLGIAGVLIFCWLQTAFWRNVRRLYQRYQDGDRLFFAMTIGLIGSIANFVAHGLVDNGVYVIDLAFVFVLLLGLSGSLHRTSELLTTADNNGVMV